MKQETKQKIFDQVSKHLLTQMQSSISESNGCLYRGPNNTKCAIGCLIPDSLYSPDIENSIVRSLVKMEAYEKFFCELLEVDKISEQDIVFLQNLQDIHDNSETHDWLNNLECFADENDLKQESLNGN